MEHDDGEVKQRLEDKEELAARLHRSPDLSMRLMTFTHSGNEAAVAHGEWWCPRLICREGGILPSFCKGGAGGGEAEAGGLRRQRTPLNPPFASFEVLCFFDSFPDQMTARYSLGCDSLNCLASTFRPVGVSSFSARSFSSRRSASCESARASPYVR